MALYAEDSVAAGTAVGDELNYGDVLFYFYQQKNFDALTSLMASRDFDRMGQYDEQAELLQGGMMLSWGQHEQASEIFERLLTETSDPAMRNRANFYLGKAWYQRGYLDRARQAFEGVTAPLQDELEAERYNLLARVYIDQGEYGKAALLLRDWEGPDAWMAYARYNLGVALVRMGELYAGADLLNQVGTMRVTNEETLALRDSANVALGFAYLQADLQAEAKPPLQRVRMNGPFSNKALLGIGWAEIGQSDYRRALAPWMELSKRDLLDSAVQESMLAIPYAFVQLDAQAQAAEYYVKALDDFAAEIDRIDQAIAEVADGSLIKALLEQDAGKSGAGYWQLPTLPSSDQSRYLYFAIADHNFHEMLKSYRDMVFLEEHMVEWESRVQAYKDMVAARQKYYGERLPAMQARIAEVDLDAVQAQYDDLKQQLADARANNDVLALATPEQKERWRRLQGLEQSPAWEVAESADARARQRVLSGLLQWDMEREFRVRGWEQEQSLEELGRELELTAAGSKSIDVIAGSIPSTVDEFDARIAAAEQNIALTRERIQASMQRHVAALNAIAIADLESQRERLVGYRTQARFALATLYDQLAARSDTDDLVIAEGESNE